MAFGLIFEGIGIGTAVAALLAGGSLRVGLSFASWASRIVARFFDARARRNQ